MTDSLGGARTGAAVSHVRSQVQHLNVVDLTGLVTQEPAGQLIRATGNYWAKLKAVQLAKSAFLTCLLGPISLLVTCPQLR
jgi:hypothetical protein